MVQNKEKENKLILIPKTEKYMEYMLQIMLKLPRTEKFSIGTEYKKSMYEMIENILIVSKIEGSKDLKLEIIHLKCLPIYI
ncbi:MAG: hypothetical protein V8R82_10780 [Clostridia bacterium]|jgi:hypothetical protein